MKRFFVIFISKKWIYKKIDSISSNIGDRISDGMGFSESDSSD